MKIKGFIYYGFGALLGAFLAAVIVACYITVTERFADNPWAWVVVLPIAFIAYPAIRSEFELVNNRRASIFTLVMFISALVSIITTLHFMGGAA